MASSTDGSLENNAQLKNAVGELIAQIPSASLSQLPRIRITATSLLNGASPEMEKLLNTLINKAENREREVEEALSSQITSGNEKIKEEDIEKNIEFLEKEREQRLDKLATEYYAFKDEFHKELEEEHKLMVRAKNGELTEQERNRLLGIHSTPEEEKAAKQKHQKMIEHYERHCLFEDETNDSIAYRKGAIKNNKELIDSPNTPAEVKNKLLERNNAHEQSLKKHTTRLDEFIPIGIKVDEARDRSRKNILEVMTKDPQIAKVKVEKYLDVYGKRHQKEMKSTPEHAVHTEIIAILKHTGLYNELGLTESKQSMDDILQGISTKREAESMKKSLKNGRPPKGPSETPNVAAKFLQGGKTKDGHGR